MNILNIFNSEKFKKIYVSNTKSAVLEIKTNIKDECSSYDPFGLCKVSDCIQCENCVYRITFDNEQIVETADFEKYFVDTNYEKYLLEFIEPIKGDVFEYLTNSKSNYKIVRIKDNVIMQYSKEEVLKIFERTPGKSKEKIDYSNKKRLVKIG